ncbi:unnamed protein product [Plutella xylostella]|uniref:(diamondback moth) hypothetical protein n=1 Tax=Plutella xylostella TaxID=51655 RepID=A0A8S4ESK3_PLUXY|nr:unnamed protein product [Plutella xylostella]
MAECSFSRCQQERRAIRKELQRWTKNMVYILGQRSGLGLKPFLHWKSRTTGDPFSSRGDVVGRGDVMK